MAKAATTTSKAKPEVNLPEHPDDPEVQVDQGEDDKKPEEAKDKYGVTVVDTIIDDKRHKEHSIVELTPDRAKSSRDAGIPLIGPLDDEHVKVWQARYLKAHGETQEDKESKEKSDQSEDAAAG